jgi:uncharacterized protein involved in propanediol utilization
MVQVSPPPPPSSPPAAATAERPVASGTGSSSAQVDAGVHAAVSCLIKVLLQDAPLLQHMIPELVSKVSPLFLTSIKLFDWIQLPP